MSLIYARLQSSNKEVALDFEFEITPRGIQHAEDTNLIPEDAKKQNQQICTLALDALVKLDEESDDQFARYTYHELAAILAADDTRVLENLFILQNTGYVKPLGNGFMISPKGLVL